VDPSTGAAASSVSDGVDASRLVRACLGLAPTTSTPVSLLSAPQFESPKCIRICARIKHKYAQIHRNGTQIYNKRFRAFIDI